LVNLKFSKWYSDYEKFANTFTYTNKYYQIEVVDEGGKALSCFKKCNYQMSNEAYDYHDHIMLKGNEEIKKCNSNYLGEVKIVNLKSKEPIKE